MAINTLSVLGLMALVLSMASIEQSVPAHV